MKIIIYLSHIFVTCIWLNLMFQIVFSSALLSIIFAFCFTVYMISLIADLEIERVMPINEVFGYFKGAIKNQIITSLIFSFFIYFVKYLIS